MSDVDFKNVVEVLLSIYLRSSVMWTLDRRCGAKWRTRHAYQCHHIGNLQGTAARSNHGSENPLSTTVIAVQASYVSFLIYFFKSSTGERIRNIEIITQWLEYWSNFCWPNLAELTVDRIFLQWRNGCATKGWSGVASKLDNQPHSAMWLECFWPGRHFGFRNKNQSSHHSRHLSPRLIFFLTTSSSYPTRWKIPSRWPDSSVSLVLHSWLQRPCCLFWSRFLCLFCQP